MADGSYVLRIEIRGPYHHDEFSIADLDREKLEPKVVEHHGHTWERYEDDEGYIEVRAEHIVTRRLRYVSTAAREVDQRAPMTHADVWDTLHHPPPRRPDAPPSPEIGDTP